MPTPPEYDSEAHRIASDPLLVQQLWLVRNGVPFDIAMSLEIDEGKAWSVIFGTFEGGEYDWSRNAWKDRR